jgi:hypothetical protein
MVFSHVQDTRSGVVALPISLVRISTNKLRSSNRLARGSPNTVEGLYYFLQTVRISCCSVVITLIVPGPSMSMTSPELATAVEH